MVHKYLTAGLLLVLALSLTACGTGDKAGSTAAYWNSGYHADTQGHVDGYHAADAKRSQAKTALDQAGKDLKQAGQDAKNAGKDLGKAAKNAARSAGDTAEDALDGMKQAAKDAADTAQKATTNR